MNIYSVTLWEQKYLDLWSIVHFNTGIMFGVLCSFLELNMVTSLLLMLILAVLWELSEAFKFPPHLREPITNQVTDVLVALVGITVAFHAFPSYQDNAGEFLTYVVPYGIFSVLLALLGKRAIDQYGQV